MTATEFWQNTLLGVLSSIHKWLLYLLSLHSGKWEGGMHTLKQISLTTVPTLLCEVSLNFYLCITLSVVHRLLVSITKAAGLMHRQILNFSVS